MRVVVKQGGAAPLEVALPPASDGATVGTLKERIRELTGIHVRKQKLLHKGRVLSDDSETLSRAGVADGAKIMLIAQQQPQTAGAASSRTQPQPTSTSTRQLDDEEEADRIRRASRLASTSPSEWTRLGGGAIVSLRSANLKELPAGMFEAVGEAARVLDAGDNALEGLPPDIAKLKNLQRLSLSKNSLADAGMNWPHLCSLLRLRELLLEFNKLSAVPADIGRLAQMRRLSLAHNQLETLPRAISDLRALERLDVAHNRHALDASSNRLNELPDSLSRLDKLQSLLLDNNNLTSLPPTLLARCRSLHTLSMRGNDMTIENLRQVEGWDAFDERRRIKYSKKMELGVLMGSAGSGGFDEGADAQEWERW
eukprot:jgi/Chlat1/1808/Chrsp135S02139